MSLLEKLFKSKEDKRREELLKQYEEGNILKVEMPENKPVEQDKPKKIPNNKPIPQQTPKYQPQNQPKNKNPYLEKNKNEGDL